MTEWFKEQKPISLILVALVLTALAMIIFGDPRAIESSSISGRVNFNGVGPEDTAARGNIVLLIKEQGQSDFVPTRAQIPFADDAQWTWRGATAGVTYDLKADLYFQGQYLKSSEALTVTAPAIDQVLVFNVSASDLPDYLSDEALTSISGNVLINGFIPENATVTLLQKNSMSDDWQEAITGLSARQTTPYQWDQALMGQTYELEARLLSAEGEIIGQSAQKNIAAPAANESLSINSTAQVTAEAATSTISGVINISGQITPNSSILMLQREIGDDTYTAFERLSASNSAAWSFDTAQVGAQYEITANLQTTDENMASGNILTVTAPADNQIIYIDTGMSTVTPSPTN